RLDRHRAGLRFARPPPPGADGHRHSRLPAPPGRDPDLRRHHRVPRLPSGRVVRAPRSEVQVLVRTVTRRSYNLWLGGFLIGVVILGALVSFVWLPHDPNALNFAAQLDGPTSENWLGADHFGRDLFSRVLVGARGTLYVGFIAVGIALVIG